MHIFCIKIYYKIEKSPFLSIKIRKISHYSLFIINGHSGILSVINVAAAAAQITRVPKSNYHCHLAISQVNLRGTNNNSRLGICSSVNCTESQVPAAIDNGLTFKSRIFIYFFTESFSKQDSLFLYRSNTK